MTEKWTRWEPIAGLANNYFLAAINNDNRGLNILFSQYQASTKNLNFSFDSSVQALRLSDEAFRLKTMYQLDELYGSDFYSSWTFFKIENSLYIAWLSDQSCGIIDSVNVHHISCFTDNIILDIVVNYEPKISFIESDQ